MTRGTFVLLASILVTIPDGFNVSMVPVALPDESLGSSISAFVLALEVLIFGGHELRKGEQYHQKAVPDGLQRAVASDLEHEAGRSRSTSRAEQVQLLGYERDDQPREQSAESGKQHGHPPLEPEHKHPKVERPRQQAEQHADRKGKCATSALGALSGVS